MAEQAAYAAARALRTSQSNRRRAVYLAAPLKYCTTLHAYTRVVPRFVVDPWQKDPHAHHRWKRRAHVERKRGRFFHFEGPLAGVNIPGWPDPGLLGGHALVETAARAQAEKLDSPEYWRRLAERTRALRDVMSVGDLTAVLDALVSGECRHTDLLRTLTRELVDDVDKLSLVEVAVVANAYAHFKVFSEPLMAALSQQASALLDTRQDADPRSVVVLAKALMSLEYRHEVLGAIRTAVIEDVEHLTFADLAEVLAVFADDKWGASPPSGTERSLFSAGEDFWKTAAMKVKGSRMASLSRALSALGKLCVSDRTLREALIVEITQGLREVPDSLLVDAGALPSASQEPMPPFAPMPVPLEMRSLHERKAAQSSASSKQLPTPISQVGDEVEIVEWDDSPFLPGKLLSDGPVDESEKRQEARKSRWYNSVSRRSFRMSAKGYADFSADESFSRNRRGSVVAEAISGLNDIWMQEAVEQGGDDGVTWPFCEIKVEEAEIALVDAAESVLRGAVHGIPPAHLIACAEVYHFSGKHGGVRSATLQRLVQECVRRLSNFSSDELLRLYKVTRADGVHDPFFERARWRHFPKLLRRQMRHVYPER